MKVYFVGAGSGDPQLITVKGKRLLEEADIIIYAGSLVNPALLDYNTGGQIYNSAGMTLDEVLEKIEEGVREEKRVVRLHTGDPSLYGAIQEQIDYLKGKGIECEVVPGVSSFVAAAAALEQELTLPDVSQTVIVTRLEGRTPVPPKESLDKLASHGATMAIFLSVHMIEGVVEELKKGYSEETPIAVVQKASWPDQKVVRGTLKDIGEKVRDEGIDKTAMILVGDVLGGNYSKSKLYDKTFTHEFRKGSE